MTFRLGGGRSIQLSYRGGKKERERGREKGDVEKGDALILCPGAVGPRTENKCVPFFYIPFFYISYPFLGGIGGAEENRTLDLRIANATLSQLSYGPGCRTGGV